MTAPQTSACKSCGAAIYWCLTEKGKLMPVDATPAPNGSLAAFVRDGKLHVRMYRSEDDINKVPKRASHFQTCPSAKQHRRRGGPAKKVGEVLDEAQAVAERKAGGE